MREDSVSNNTLRERYLSIKKRSKSDYNNILILVAKAENLSMNEAAFLMGVVPQNIHVKLNNLVALGLLSRERKQGRQNVKEYQYSLASDIDSHELQELTGDDLPPEINERLQQLLSAVPVNMTQPIGHIETIQTPIPKAQELHHKSSLPDSIADQLLAKLPNFDPTWPEEMQSRWMASFEAITRRIMEETDD